jgi:tol-pal system protein YbgF
MRWQASWLLIPLLVSGPAYPAAFGMVSQKELDAQLAQQLGQLKTDLQAQSEARFKTIEARIDELENTVKNLGLLNLLQQVEQLKQDIALLKGQGEVSAHDVAQLGKRQNDLYLDLDKRIEALKKAQAELAASMASVQDPPADASTEGTPPDTGSPGASPGGAAATPAGPAPYDPLAEARTYDAALAKFKAADYKGSIEAFRGFMAAYPGSTLLPNAYYWVGYAYYVLGDFQLALNEQQTLLSRFPTSSKAPDAMLNIASCQAELKDQVAARKTLQALTARYPGTNAAVIASKRLASGQ